MVDRLAIKGGTPAFTETVERYNTIGVEELSAVTKVLRSGNLSQFLGEKDQDFYGGPRVLEFEESWSKYFSVAHSISVNSCTSGLIAAIGAVGVEPGDEVIVSTWTMCATATAALVWNAVPVFVDIEDETFNLDPEVFREKITERTRAVVVTNIFGHGARLDEIKLIARESGIAIIEDNAQAPGAMETGRFTGTIGDIGVFSLNYHKHIHTGEGGICVTNNRELAERMRLIRNHGEAVVESSDPQTLTNMVGFNFRMGEMEAAIGIEQLKKLPCLIEEKQAWATQLDQGLEDLCGLRTPLVRPNCSHVYYAYPLLVDEKILGVKRDIIYDALVAEGVPLLGKSFTLIHSLPLYQNRIAYGQKGFPWVGSQYQGAVCYDDYNFTVANNLLNERYMNLALSLGHFDSDKLYGLIGAFRKVWSNTEQLL